MSDFATTGLVVGVYTSFRNGLAYLDSYVEHVDAYTHTLATEGWYQDASITIKGDLDFVEDWYANGLGRHIVVRDEAGATVFEGFVNSVRISVGALTAVRGPLMDVVNRAHMVYSVVDTTTAPPTVGQRERTQTFGYNDSSSKYGLLYRILSAGGIAAANVSQTLTTYLLESKEPLTNETLTFGNEGSAPTVTLEVEGYVSWLATFPYVATSSGTITVRNKLLAVLAASLNSTLFSTDYSQVGTNGTLVQAYDNDDRTALAVVKSLVAIGDSLGTRYYYGFGDERRFLYNDISATFAYRHRLADNSQRIEDLNGGTVQPWAVKPAKWILISDFLSGAIVPSDIAQDPRALFAETVTYTAPYGLTINGGRVATLPQKLARLGLSGIGA